MNRIYQKLQTREGLMILGSIALVFAMFALLGLGVYAFARTSHHDTVNGGTITVSGTGEIFAKPDIATFTATVNAKAKMMADAEKSATDQNNALIAKLADAGIANDDIKTTDYSAYPNYENKAVSSMIECFAYPCPQPRADSVISGYTVSQSVSIKVRDLDKAGDIAKLLADANVSNISGPNFAIDNPQSVQNDARDKAIMDARAQAKVLAGQLGVKLGKIVDFQISGNGGPVYPMAYSAKMDSVAGAAAPSPVLNPGQTDITSNVSITYQIR